MATRSPSPASPAYVRGSAPSADPRPGHLGQPARDQGGASVVAIAEPVADPGGDRDHVLGGPAELDAAHVPRGVDAEARRGERALQGAGHVGVGARDHARGRLPGRDLLGVVRPRERRHPPRVVPGRLDDHIAEQAVRRGIETLGQREHERAGLQAGARQPSRRRPPRAGRARSARPPAPGARSRAAPAARRPRAGCGGNGCSRAAPSARLRRAGRGRRARRDARPWRAARERRTPRAATDDERPHCSALDEVDDDGQPSSSAASRSRFSR